MNKKEQILQWAEVNDTVFVAVDKNLWNELIKILNNIKEYKDEN